MKEHFYRNLYSLLSWLSNRVQSETLIRYKIFIGCALVGISAGHTQQAIAQEKKTDTQSHILTQDSIIKAENITIKGQVLEAETKEAIAGANIYVEGTTYGTISDSEGKFTFTIPADIQKITVNYIGLKQVTIQVEPVMEILMEDDDMILCYEIVVMDYQESKRQKEIEKQQKKTAKKNKQKKK